MIETDLDYNKFKLENLEGDLFLHIIPSDENCHPAVSLPSILFIRNLSTGKTYYYSFNHPDSVSLVHRIDFLENLLAIKNRKWALDKKAFSQMLIMPSLNDVNLIGYLKDNSLVDLSVYETPAHYLVRKHASGHPKINLAIPLMKHMESFNELADDVSKILESATVDFAYTNFNNLIIDTLADLESSGIFVDRNKFMKHFETDPGTPAIVHSQYNVYTSTGRPSNRFGGINYAALNQSDGSRSCFCSRYGTDGRLVLIDYTAFHPRIICTLTQYSIPIEMDIYGYLAKLYFHKEIVDETDIKNSKKLTFRQLYGGVEDEYSHIKYLANLKTFINEQWNFFQKNKYVITPFFKRKITEHHIQDPSPAKVFNYILQAIEGEIAIPKLKEVQTFLKKKRTRAILYTYDSVLYDFHKDDGLDTLVSIRNIMSFGGRFPMKTYIGQNYQDMQLITL